MNEDLESRLDEEKLRNKELQHEVADLRLTLHRSQHGILSYGGKQPMLDGGLQ